MVANLQYVFLCTFFHLLINTFLAQKFYFYSANKRKEINLWGFHICVHSCIMQHFFSNKFNVRKLNLVIKLINYHSMKAKIEVFQTSYIIYVNY